MKLWGKYLVSDECDDWRDPVRHFEGVYTDKALAEDKNTYYHEGYKQCKKVLKALNEHLESLIAKRNSLSVQMSKLLENTTNTKKLKKERRKLQKDIETVSWNIKNTRKDIEKYENGIKSESFCTNIGLERCGVVYEEIEFFVTDYEREVLERFLFI